MITKTYTELAKLDTFEDRFTYLKLGGVVGHSTFGFDRHINQLFYTSQQWKQVRRHVAIRDNGCDLGISGHEIHGSVLVHHMNPMESDDIIHGEAWILDPEFLITTIHNTHNAIHYGDESLLPKVVIAREAGDTKLW